MESSSGIRSYTMGNKENDMKCHHGGLISKEIYGTTPDGDVITRYDLRNLRGMEVSIIDYGSTIIRMVVPNADGKPTDVVLGFTDLKDNLHVTSHIGSEWTILYSCWQFFASGVVGRFANRIANSAITLDGTDFTLPTTCDGCILHGGTAGFHKRKWGVSTFSDQCPEVVVCSMKYMSTDGEQGFPGNLQCVVTYILKKKVNSLKIRFQATTDKKTVVNLT